MNKAGKTESSQQYLMAHRAHYTTKDLGEAIRLYRAVMEAHPKAQEAAYARSQIQNIVSNVVPEQELFDLMLQLAWNHIDNERSPTVEPTPVELPTTNRPE